jgi:hypothetical protein
VHTDIALVMATFCDGQQRAGDWLDLNYEERRLQHADSPVASPAAMVGLNATRKYDLQAKDG